MFIKRSPVKSSAISSIGYNAEKKVLEIEYFSGDVYDYFDVPEHIFNELMQAESKGTFANKMIKDHYEFEKKE
ncbi:KTSC domain-containing protein [Pinibacter aurantiacus]|uniref:KTSC domain-containing protein n=1 Tax=Pinibacter aurantiacus TaxID=2851599 RepID=A0A9E2SCS5_9BACT|nr:KTSC domain-containing protein [Pinibacter aurantiacus]MBV4358957.1 KTSC domain-containing protein [Pinibacter aurantiacus]